MEDFGLLIPDGVGAKRDRRLHGREADELHDVIGHHVTQRARLVIVAAALLYAHRFRNANLNLGNVAPVPAGLEYAVGKAKSQDILEGLPPQIAIDAVNPLFVAYLLALPV